MNIADRLALFKEFRRKDRGEASIGVTVDPGCNGEAGGKGSDQELGNYCGGIFTNTILTQLASFSLPCLLSLPLLPSLPPLPSPNAPYTTLRLS